jgi:BirA family biotin operon repressor/biotin-[acetyl-CoA-carboxylase] ligase
MISDMQTLIILPSVDSTNNYAMAQVRAGTAINGQGWLALEQTAGRGQREKTWVAEPGKNITLSMALQPNLPATKRFLLSATVALGAWDFYQQKAGDETRIKWPNDIYWRDRKAGGILIENTVASLSDGGAKWNWAIIGIGLNVNQEKFVVPYIEKAVSLREITGQEWNIIELAHELVGCLRKRLREINTNSALLQEYNNVLYKNGECVKLKKHNRIFDAVINGVNEQGELNVTTTLEECFGFGEVEWML